MAKRHKDGIPYDFTDEAKPDYSDVEKGLSSENGSLAAYFDSEEFTGSLYGTVDFEEDVRVKAREIAISRHARQLVDAATAGPKFEFPEEPGRTLADDLEARSDAPKWLVKGWLPRGGNALLIAQKKSGKTTLALNLSKCLADDEPFLGRFKVEKLDGRVAFWNHELTADMFRDWAEEIGFEHPERVAEPLHLRGVHVPFWLPEVMDEAVEWLKKNEVQFWIIDPAAVASAGLVENENDNAQWRTFTHTLDQVKRRAGIDGLFLTHHMAKADVEEDKETGRGGGRLEDWADSIWVLRKDSEERRTLRAFGRDVDQQAIDLHYRPTSRRYKATGQTRDARREIDACQSVVDAVVRLKESGDYPPATSHVEQAMEGIDNNKRNAAIQKAEDKRYIKRLDGPRKAKLCELTKKGQELASREQTMPAKKRRRKPR